MNFVYEINLDHFRRYTLQTMSNDYLIKIRKSLTSIVNQITLDTDYSDFQSTYYYDDRLQRDTNGQFESDDFIAYYSLHL